MCCCRADVWKIEVDKSRVKCQSEPLADAVAENWLNLCADKKPEEAKVG